MEISIVETPVTLSSVKESLVAISVEESLVVTSVEESLVVASIEEVITTVEIVGVGPQGSSSGTSEMQAETPSGVVNGANATFVSTYAFVPESVAVYVNGLLQRKVTDYNTSGSNTILFSSSPLALDAIFITYLRA